MSAAAVVAGLASAALVAAMAAALRRAAHRHSSVALRRRLSVRSPADRLSATAMDVAGGAPSWFVQRIDALDLGVPPATLWRRWLAAAAAAVLSGPVMGEPAVSIVALAAVVSLPVVVPRVARGRRARRIDAQLPSLLDAIGSSLRAGASLRQAVLESATTAAAPLGRALGPAVLATHAGSSLADELDRWAGSCDSSSVRMAVAALSLGLRDGGPQTQAIEGVAATMRDRLALSGEIRALSSQARASAAVIVVAPVVFTIVSAMVDRDVLEFLVGSPAGLACVAVGFGLDAAGAMWMAAIMRRAT